MPGTVGRRDDDCFHSLSLALFMERLSYHVSIYSHVFVYTKVCRDTIISIYTKFDARSIFVVYHPSDRGSHSEKGSP